MEPNLNQNQSGSSLKNGAALFFSMRDFIKKWTPADTIALVLIIGAIILKIRGADGTTTAILAIIPTYYFGKQARKPE